MSFAITFTITIPQPSWSSPYSLPSHHPFPPPYLLILEYTTNTSHSPSPPSPTPPPTPPNPYLSSPYTIVKRTPPSSTTAHTSSWIMPTSMWATSQCWAWTTSASAQSTSLINYYPFCTAWWYSSASTPFSTNSISSTCN